MNVRLEPTPQDWFRQAARAYVEGHQGCVWCDGAHRVYRSERGTCVEYLCSCCEFYAIHDRAANRYFAAPGQEQMIPGAPAPLPT
jgi:hypothetical protein